MADVTLGKTKITVNKNGFGALPVQRVSVEEAGTLLKRRLIMESPFSIRPGPTVIVRKSWAWLLKGFVRRFTLPPRRRQIRRRDSGGI